MTGSISERLHSAPVGSKEYFKALRDDALSAAGLAHAKGMVETRRDWLHTARRHTKLLKTITDNETWEKEHRQRSS